MLRFIGFYDYTVILTYVSLFSAVVGMTLSTNGMFHMAVVCLMISGICDAFDGTVARSKKNRTEDEKAFGIQIDSLVDVISFGIFPALLCYRMGVDGVLGVLCVFFYSLCGLIRLAFFNVMEGKRQQMEQGANKVYRGLPITSMSMILPPFYLLRFVLPEGIFVGLLHVLLVVVGFLFVLDFPVKKLSIHK